MKSFGTYHPEDVTILLKDITGLVTPMSTEDRERAIQHGRHYCEMLPIEYQPSPAYLAAYEDALARYAEITARAVAVTAENIWRVKGKNAVLVSLARAGTPIGILLKHEIARRHHVTVPHYTISIIRGVGIDHVAMRYILDRHAPCDLQFVDGWTGKGAIQRQLDAAMVDYPGVSPKLAVLSDPACVSGICGTHEDFLIASSCLNSTVSGLLSRTFLRRDIISPEDFHGAVFYKELQPHDMTYAFLDAIEAAMPEDVPVDTVPRPSGTGLAEAERIAAHFGVQDINLVKPGIGEATRVLLRRLPWKILVHSKDDAAHLGHIYQLAKEKGVPVEEYPLVHYRACGIIRAIADT